MALLTDKFPIQYGTVKTHQTINGVGPGRAAAGVLNAHFQMGPFTFQAGTTNAPPERQMPFGGDIVTVLVGIGTDGLGGTEGVFRLCRGRDDNVLAMGVVDPETAGSFFQLTPEAGASVEAGENVYFQFTNNTTKDITLDIIDVTIVLA